jgi:DNA polymerase epsilon subunit 2
MNPGGLVEGVKGREGRARWVEYDVRMGTGVVRSEE